MMERNNIQALKNANSCLAFFALVILYVDTLFDPSKEHFSQGSHVTFSPSFVLQGVETRSFFIMVVSLTKFAADFILVLDKDGKVANSHIMTNIVQLDCTKHGHGVVTANEVLRHRFAAHR